MEYFLKTKRVGFATWKNTDYTQAETLWGNKLVTKYICAAGAFTLEEIRKRLETEVRNEEKYGVQYWPIYTIESGQFLGCCGLRSHRHTRVPNWKTSMVRWRCEGDSSWQSVQSDSENYASG